MQIVVLLALLFCIFQGGKPEARNTSASTLASALASFQFNRENSSRTLESFETPDNKFTCVLNLLRSALTEEIENSQCQQPMIEPTHKSALSTLNCLIEDENAKKAGNSEMNKTLDANETDTEKTLYRKVITKIASALSTPKNQCPDMPSMIPIFKPRTVMPRNDLNQNFSDYKPRPNQNSRPVSFVPEKIQASMNLISNHPMFNIPCQRAVDVLDMTNIAIPKDVCEKADFTLTSPKVNPIVEVPGPNLANQSPAPITLSVNCADTEDTVAMLFKPKTISLMQLYGNLLKNITMTVLVPYHMSKLTEKL